MEKQNLQGGDCTLYSEIGRHFVTYFYQLFWMPTMLDRGDTS